MAGGFHHIGGGNDANDLLVVGEYQRRFSGVGQLFQCLAPLLQRNLFFVHQAAVAGVVAFAVDLGLDAFAWQR